MTNPFKHFNEERKMRKLARSFDPSRAAKKNAKNAFMAAVHEELGTSHVRSYAWMKFTLAAVIALVVLNGSAVIYADTTDVPATHPLYTYKRVAEDVKVAVASPSKKAEVQAKIAERRNKELTAILSLEASVGTSTASTTATTTATSTSATSTATSTATTTATSTKPNEKSERNAVIKKKLMADIKAEVKALKSSVKNLSTSTAVTKKKAVCDKLGLIKKNMLLQLDAGKEIELDINEICDVKEQTNNSGKKDPIATTTVKTQATTSVKSDIRQEDRREDRKDDARDNSGLENRQNVLDSVKTKIGL